MKRLLALAVMSFLVATGASYAQAPKMKEMTALGKVKSVAAASVVVTDKAGKDWTFAVDKETRVVAKGASTKAAASKASGASLSIVDLIKAGQNVRVRYHDMGGTMHAAEVRVQ